MVLRYLTCPKKPTSILQREALLGSYFSSSSVDYLWAVLEAAWDIASELGVEVF
jgi:hypothetical protein